MPRIKRWFPVSHDINRDPELWDLEAQFGGKVVRVWLELLSIADRNEGDIPGELNSISTAVSWASRIKTTKGRQILDSIMTKGWLHIDGCLKVTKWAKYHRIEEQKKVPSEPSEPDLTKPDHNKTPAAVFVLPDWIPEKSWRDFEEHRRKMRTPLSTRAKELAVRQLELLRKEGHEPATVLDNCIARGWRGIFAPKENGSKPPPPKPRAKIERPPELTEEQIEKNKAFLKDLLGKIGAKG